MDNNSGKKLQLPSNRASQGDELSKQQQCYNEYDTIDTIEESEKVKWKKEEEIKQASKKNYSLPKMCRREIK